MIECYEAGTTIQFTLVCSNAPSNTPIFSVTGSGDTLVSSGTAQQSSSTEFYAMYTMPMSLDGNYLYQWYAESSASGDTLPYRKSGRFVVRTPQRA